MNYIDFHTHQQHADGRIAIVDGIHTWGIHPWKADGNDIEVEHINPSSLMAIGECGLDKLCSTPLEWQKQAFLSQIQLSEQYHKPLIIHCVKAIDDLLQIHHQAQPTQPWIFHGFRGKPRQLQTLLSRGMYVSFGFHYNPESLQLCPLDKLLLESDQDMQPISQLYHEAAQLHGITVDTLLTQMQENRKRLFFDQNVASLFKKELQV